MENFEKAEHAVEVWRYLSTSETGVLSAPDIKMIKLSTSAQELQRILPVTRSQSYGGNKKRKEKKKKLQSFVSTVIKCQQHLQQADQSQNRCGGRNEKSEEEKE